MGNDREDATSPLPTPRDPSLGSTFDELEPLSSDVLAKLRRRAPESRPAAAAPLDERRRPYGPRGGPAPAAGPPAGPVSSSRRARDPVSTRGPSARTRHARIPVERPPLRLDHALLGPLVIGLLFAAGLGMYGRTHSPATYSVVVAPFTNVNYLKAWLASVAAACALVQLASGSALVRRLDSDPVIVDAIHRWSGRLAVLVSVPVAVDCLYAMGFQADDLRILVHSCAGCLFYGAFTAKMLAIGRSGLPRWTYPLLGGLMFTCLALLWLTSARWLFGTTGVHL